MVFESFEELSESFTDLKRSRKLHPITEDRLAELLNDIYPEAYAKPEPGEIPGGRSDLAFYFGDGRYATFEVFATRSQVPQDLRHLEQSVAQARVAILTDPVLDNGAIFDEYFAKKPRAPFPWLKLSDILVAKNEANAKKKLKDYIDAAFASEQTNIEGLPLPILGLKLYKMGRDQRLQDGIHFETHRALPQNHQFGIALVNTTSSSMTRGIHIRLEFFWRGHKINKAPSFRAPRCPGWRTQVSELVYEQPAVFTFRDPDLPCFYRQPIQWDNAWMTLPQQMNGRLLAHYVVSSIEPHSDNTGKLVIALGEEGIGA